jgi:hypothetical protein
VITGSSAANGIPSWAARHRAPPPSEIPQPGSPGEQALVHLRDVRHLARAVEREQASGCAVRARVGSQHHVAVRRERLADVADGGAVPAEPVEDHHGRIAGRGRGIGGLVVRVREAHAVVRGEERVALRETARCRAPRADQRDEQHEREDEAPPHGL